MSYYSVSVYSVYQAAIWTASQFLKRWSKRVGAMNWPVEGQVWNIASIKVSGSIGIRLRTVNMRFW